MKQVGGLKRVGEHCCRTQIQRGCNDLSEAVVMSQSALAVIGFRLKDLDTQFLLLLVLKHKCPNQTLFSLLLPTCVFLFLPTLSSLLPPSHSFFFIFLWRWISRFSNQLLITSLSVFVLLHSTLQRCYMEILHWGSPGKERTLLACAKEPACVMLLSISILQPLHLATAW